MVYEVEMTNVGVGEGAEFVLYAQQRDNEGSLKLFLDGEQLTGNREFSNILKDTSYRKTLVVQKGPRLFEYASLDLSLESSCGGDSDSIQLYNNLVDRSIEFVKPCPKVEWAGELKRDQYFVVNLNSDDQENLKIGVFNPNHGEMSFKEMIDSTRLETVHLHYREIDTLRWSDAFTNVIINGKSDSKKMDFSGEYAKESDYGYANMKWELAGKVKEGNYEVKVQSKCKGLLNAPDSMTFFNTPTLKGVVDLTRPEQYGKELPLRDVVLGEEIVVVFTEPINCKKPYTFDIEMKISGRQPLNRDQLHVICTGRKLGIQIDPTSLNDIQTILGKHFTVEIGRIPIGDTESPSNIFDINGNGYNLDRGNIKIQKNFFPLNVQEASTSFTLKFKAFDQKSSCLLGIKDSNDIKTKIVQHLGMEASDMDRLKFENMQCLGNGAISVEIKISPSILSQRKLLRKDVSVFDDYPLNLFNKFKSISEESEE